jgi:hypothetical protein
VSVSVCACVCMCVFVCVCASVCVCVCVCVRIRCLGTTSTICLHISSCLACRFCPFVNMTQSHKKAGFFSGSLGQYHGMSRSAMLFTNGNKCASGKMRETAVSFKCGSTYGLSSVLEPSTCAYTAIFTCPEACVSLQLHVPERDVAILSVTMAACLRVVAATTDAPAAEADRVQCLPLLQSLVVPFDTFERDGRSHVHHLVLPEAVVNAVTNPVDAPTPTNSAASVSAGTPSGSPPLTNTISPRQDLHDATHAASMVNPALR